MEHKGGCRSAPPFYPKNFDAQGASPRRFQRSPSRGIFLKKAPPAPPQKLLLAAKARGQVKNLPPIH